MKVTILGCGTSSGVPRIGGDWGMCDPNDVRNARTRASILLQSATTTILVDTSPDLRQQLLAARVGAIDAVIWTHDHADHCHGIDDLRQVFHARGQPIDGYARDVTRASLTARFGYVFHGNAGYPATVSLAPLGQRQRIGDIDVSVVDMPHGPITSAGLRFDHDGKSAGYATDFSAITPAMIDVFTDLDLWVVDALRERPHPTHPHLAMTLEGIAHCAPKRALLTHMDQSMDYAALSARLPDGVRPAYDGQEVTL